MPKNTQKNNEAGFCYPLSSHTKNNIIQELKKIDKEKLKAALVAAARNRCKFPSEIQKILSPMYAACKLLDEEADAESLDCQNQAIGSYLKNSGFKKIQNLLNSSSDEEDWSSELLYTLAKNLKIEIKPEPVVQVAIQKGKVHWRILKNGEEKFYRHRGTEKAFDFKNAKTWFMTWDQFRLFKDAGKRKGSVKITKDIFVLPLKEQYREQAGAIWDELKKVGILDKNDRISDALRATSNIDIELSTVSTGAVTLENVKNCLAELREDDDEAVIDEETFVAYWVHPYKSRASLIWHELRRRNYIDDDYQITSLKQPFLTNIFLNEINFSYKDVIDRIYKIANSKYSETLCKDIPEFKISRPERSLKSCAVNGGSKVRNSKEDDLYTNLWDVGVYGDLNAHRNSAQEKENNDGDIFNYDHIPSYATLKAYNNDEFKKKYEKKLDVLNTKFKNEKNAKQKILIKSKIKIIEAKKAALESEAQEPKETKAVKNEAQEKKTEKHGPLFWAIAIPKQLHHVGSTYMEKASAQNLATGGYFLRDVKSYFKSIEDCPKKFSFSDKEKIKALGAFRHLYKQNLKKPQTLNGQYTTGLTSYYFFKQEGERKGVDEFFTAQVQGILQAIEGSVVTLKPA